MHFASPVFDFRDRMLDDAAGQIQNQIWSPVQRLENISCSEAARGKKSI